MPLSVDEKEVALVPKLLPGSAVKSLLVPLGTHIAVEVDICSRGHRLLLAPTLQMVTPFISPVTVHLKVKLSPGQVGGAAVNCPVTSPGEKLFYLYTHSFYPVSVILYQCVGFLPKQNC